MERCRIGAFVTNLGKFNEGEIVGEVDPKKTSVEELGLYMSGAKRDHQEARS